MTTPDPNESLRESVLRNLNSWRAVRRRYDLPEEELLFRIGVLETTLEGQEPRPKDADYRLLSQIISKALDEPLDDDEYALIAGDPRVAAAEERVRRMGRMQKIVEASRMTEMLVLYEGVKVVMENEHS